MSNKSLFTEQIKNNISNNQVAQNSKDKKSVFTSSIQNNLGVSAPADVGTLWDKVTSEIQPSKKDTSASSANGGETLFNQVLNNATGKKQNTTNPVTLSRKELKNIIADEKKKQNLSAIKRSDFSVQPDNDVVTRLKDAYWNTYTQEKDYTNTKILPKYKKAGRDNESARLLSYLDKKGLKDEIKEYSAHIKAKEDRAANEYNYEIKKAAYKNDKLKAVTDSLKSVPANLVGGPVAEISNIVQMGKNTIGTGNGTINVYDDWHKLANYSINIRSAVSENIESKIGQFAYQTGMSMADSAVVALIGSALGGMGLSDAAASSIATIPLASSAANQTTKEMLDNGYTPQQAFRMGIASGFSEFITEKYSIENLLSRGPVTSLKSFANNVAKQAFAEGSEEVASNILNRIFEAGILGTESQNYKLVNYYMRQGDSKEKAYAKVLRNNLYDDLVAFAGGFISGGIMGGVVTAVQTDVQIKNLSKTAINNGTDGIIINTALSLPKTSEAYKYVSKLNGNISNKQLGTTILLIDNYVKESKSDIVYNAVYNRAIEFGATKSQANAVAEYKASIETQAFTSTEELLKSFNSAISSRPGALVLDEMSATDGNTRVWVEGLNNKLAPLYKIDSDMSIALGTSTTKAPQSAVEDTAAEQPAVSGNNAPQVEDTPQVKPNSMFDEPDVSPLTYEETDTFSGAKVQKVDESKLTYRHRLVRDIGRAFGTKITFGHIQNKADGFEVVGTNEIVIDYETKDPVRCVLIHELTHFAKENASTWNQFVAIIKKSKEFQKYVNNYKCNNEWLQTDLDNAKTFEDKLAVIREDRITQYSNKGVEISPAVADEEIFAKFFGDTTFVTSEDLDTSLKNLLDAAENYKERSAISEFLHQLKQWVLNKLGKTDVYYKLSDIEKEWLKLVKEAQSNYESKEQKTTADNGGVKYIIGYTDKNIPVAIVEENILDGVPKSDWVKTVKKIITDKFSAGIPISGRLIKVNKITKSEFTNSKYSKYIKGADGTIYADKFKTANNLDDVILATTNYINEDLNHERTDNIKEFARGDVLIRVGNNDYSAKVIVGFTNSQNMVLYDIVDFEKTDFEIKKKAPHTSAMQNAGSQRNEMSSNHSIPTTSEKVNTKFSLPDTEYLELAKEPEKNEAKLREMVDKAAKDAGYNSPILYHGTPNGEFTIFDMNKSTYSNSLGRGFYFTDKSSVAGQYRDGLEKGGLKKNTRKILSAYIKLQNPFIVSPNNYITLDEAKELLINSKLENWAKNDFWRDFIRMSKDNRITTRDFINRIADLEQVIPYSKYDGIIDRTFGDVYSDYFENDAQQYVVYNSSQIKSADPVTYDDEGNIIPLSERFNPSNEDIRYSISDNLYNTSVDFTAPMEYEEFATLINKENDITNYFPKYLSKDFVKAIRKADFTKPKLYRGIEAAELDYLLENGYIKSNGEYNFFNQQGQTLFDEDARYALGYATTFAPKEISAKHYKDGLPSYLVEIVNSPNLNFNKNNTQESYTYGEIPQEYITRIFEITYNAETGTDYVQDVTNSEVIKTALPNLGKNKNDIIHGMPMFYRDKTTGTILYAVQGEDGFENGWYISEKDPSMKFSYKKTFANINVLKMAKELWGISGKESDLEEINLFGNDEDIRYSMPDVDNANKNNYNSDNEVNDDGTNSEILGKRTIPTVDGSRNDVRQQSTNTEKLRGYLEKVLRRSDKNQQDISAGNDGWLYEELRQKFSVNSFHQFITSIRGRIQGRQIQSTDSIGRVLNKNIQQKFAKTIFADSNGKIFSLYHWTKSNFSNFEKGEFGFHFGTLEAAHDIYIEKADPNITGTGIYKEVYLNITNPLYCDFDAGIWTAESMAYQLSAIGKISNAEYERICEIDGAIDNTYDNNAANHVRELLRQLGYDGVVYYNESENKGSLSAIALDNDQILTVAENGVLKENTGVTEASDEGAFSMPENKYSIADEQWDKSIEDYGAIDETAEVKVPKSVDGDKVVTRLVNNVLNHTALSDEDLEAVKVKTLENEFSHTVFSDEKAIEIAENKLEKGIAKDRWNEVKAGGIVEKSDIAIGELLMKQAIENGNSADFMDILSDLAEVATRAGRTVQAYSMISKMNGIGKLMHLQKEVDKLNADLDKKTRGRSAPIKLNEKIARQIAESKIGENIESIVEDAKNDIARQVPSTFLDKWNAWRYLAMLANPRTHIRNIVGNAIFVPAVRIKNVIGALGEIFIKQENRTKSLVLKPEYRNFAEKYAKGDNVQESLGGSKYSDKSDIMERVKVFKTKALEKARVLNSDLLEKEDLWFKNKHFIGAFGGFLQARGVDLNNISPETLQKATEYAVNEALKATFNDANNLATAINSLTNKSKIADIMVNGVIPFKKTPLNIVNRGIEYSPLGLVKTLTKGIYDLNKGNITATEFVDGLGAGISGTLPFFIGMLLSSLGWVTGGFGDDDEDKFKKLAGEQEYAIKIGDSTYTIDWAAPACIPFFMGVESWSAFDEKGVSFSDLSSTVWQMLDPLINLSCLSGMQSVIESAKFSKGSEVLGSIATSAVTSYFGQAAPTIGGAVARTFDESRRSTYIDKNSKMDSTSQQFIQNVQGKIPYLENKKAEKVDEWGRTISNGKVGERVVENFISPGYFSKTEYTKVDKELKRLADKTGENTFPPTAKKYLTINGERIDFTAKQYVEYAKFRGRKNFELINSLINNSLYKSLDDDQKATAIKKAYDYTGDLSKAEFTDYTMHKSWDYLKNKPSETQAKLIIQKVKKS